MARIELAAPASLRLQKLPDAFADEGVNESNWEERQAFLD